MSTGENMVRGGKDRGIKTETGGNPAVSRLSEETQSRLKSRVRELIEGADGWRSLRQLMSLCEDQLSHSLGIHREEVGVLAEQADLVLSTLGRFIRAQGGQLELQATLPGFGAMRIDALADLSDSV